MAQADLHWVLNDIIAIFIHSKDWLSSYILSLRENVLKTKLGMSVYRGE